MNEPSAEVIEAWIMVLLHLRNRARDAESQVRALKAERDGLIEQVAILRAQPEAER